VLRALVAHLLPTKRLELTSSGSRCYFDPTVPERRALEAGELEVDNDMARADLRRVRVA
jgi:hypothetical protein